MQLESKFMFSLSNDVLESIDLGAPLTFSNLGFLVLSSKASSSRVSRSLFSLLRGLGFGTGTDFYFDNVGTLQTRFDPARFYKSNLGKPVEEVFFSPLAPVSSFIGKSVESLALLFPE